MGNTDVVPERFISEDPAYWSADLILNQAVQNREELQNLYITEYRRMPIYNEAEYIMEIRNFVNEVVPTTFEKVRKDTKNSKMSCKSSEYIW